MNLLKQAHIRNWLLIVLLIPAVDQITKWLVITNFGYNQKFAVMPGLNFNLSYNQGAAFGLLNDAGGWQRWLFIGIAIVVSTVIYTWSVKLPKHKVLERVALACILGGAIGNLYDRIRYGYVIDFIDLYIANWHWYTFNIADIGICVGAVLFVLSSIKQK